MKEFKEANLAYTINLARAMINDSEFFIDKSVNEEIIEAWMKNSPLRDNGVGFSSEAMARLYYTYLESFKIITKVKNFYERPTNGLWGWYREEINKVRPLIENGITYLDNIPLIFMPKEKMALASKLLRVRFDYFILISQDASTIHYAIHGLDNKFIQTNKIKIGIAEILTYPLLKR